MSDDAEQTALLTEIRDLQRQQIELAQQTLKNQEAALANQQKAIDKQITNQQILIQGRKWTRILLALLVAGVFIYLIQPILFLWYARPR
jgi:hypothetical protein